MNPCWWLTDPELTLTFEEQSVRWQLGVTVLAMESPAAEAHFHVAGVSVECSVPGMLD